MPPHELVAAYFDGQLSPQERKEAEQLLLDDPQMRKHLADLRKIRTCFSQLPGYTLPRDFYRQVLGLAKCEYSDQTASISRPPAAVAGAEASPVQDHADRTGGADAKPAIRQLHDESGAKSAGSSQVDGALGTMLPDLSPALEGSAPAAAAGEPSLAAMPVGSIEGGRNAVPELPARSDRTAEFGFEWEAAATPRRWNAPLWISTAAATLLLVGVVAVQSDRWLSVRDARGVAFGPQSPAVVEANNAAPTAVPAQSGASNSFKYGRARELGAGGGQPADSLESALPAGRENQKSLTLPKRSPPPAVSPPRGGANQNARSGQDDDRLDEALAPAKEQDDRQGGLSSSAGKGGQIAGPAASQLESRSGTLQPFGAQAPADLAQEKPRPKSVAEVPAERRLRDEVPRDLGGGLPADYLVICDTADALAYRRFEESLRQRRILVEAEQDASEATHKESKEPGDLGLENLARANAAGEPAANESLRVYFVEADQEQLDGAVADIQSLPNSHVTVQLWHAQRMLNDLERAQTSRGGQLDEIFKQLQEQQAELQSARQHGEVARKESGDRRGSNGKASGPAASPRSNKADQGGQEKGGADQPNDGSTPADEAGQSAFSQQGASSTRSRTVQSKAQAPSPHGASAKVANLPDGEGADGQVYAGFAQPLRLTDTPLGASAAAGGRLKLAGGGQAAPGRGVPTTPAEKDEKSHPDGGKSDNGRDSRRGKAGAPADRDSDRGASTPRSGDQPSAKGPGDRAAAAPGGPLVAGEEGAGPAASRGARAIIIFRMAPPAATPAAPR
jgi:hypothetical protein